MNSVSSAAFVFWASEGSGFGLQCRYMKIVVAIKRVPAPEQRVGIGPNGRIDEGGLSFVINPFDAIALEEALRIRESGRQPVEILAISIGRDECEDQLRTARVERETDAGIETVTIKLPAVITADLRLNEPRYASLPSIIKARKKPIEQLAVEELAVALEPRAELVQLELASSVRTCARVKDVAELVNRLRHEAKVV